MVQIGKYRVILNNHGFLRQVGARDYEAASKYLLEEALRIQTLAATRDDLHVEVALCTKNFPLTNAPHCSIRCDA